MGLLSTNIIFDENVMEALREEGLLHRITTINDAITPFLIKALKALEAWAS